jgi:hypothetical protein
VREVTRLVDDVTALVRSSRRLAIATSALLLAIATLVKLL